MKHHIWVGGYWAEAMLHNYTFFCFQKKGLDADLLKLRHVEFIFLSIITLLLCKVKLHQGGRLLGQLKQIHADLCGLRKFVAKQ